MTEGQHFLQRGEETTLELVYDWQLVQRVVQNIVGISGKGHMNKAMSTADRVNGDYIMGAGIRRVEKEKWGKYL